MEDNPKQRQMALVAMSSSAGWSVYCARFDEIVRKQIDAKVWDLKTTDADRRSLVAARQLLQESCTPAKMIESMLTVLEGEILRLAAKK